MQYLPIIATAAMLNLFAAVSPGPDFLMVVKNSLSYSRKTGIYTAIGIGLGILIHLSYCAVGIGIIISKSTFVFNIIKYIGAAYLLYLGVGSITAKKSNIEIEKEKGPVLSNLVALRTGFLTNVLNPKATLFFLGIFSFVISPEIPAFVIMVIGSIMVGTAIIWFVLVSIFFTQKKLKNAYYRFEKPFNVVFGLFLVILAVKIGLQ